MESRGGPTVVAVPESDSDRRVRKMWELLTPRVLDVTRHDEPTHTSAAQHNLREQATPGSQCLGTAAVLDHTYLDIEQWQHQFNRTKAGPTLSPFQVKARGTSDHSPVWLSIEDDFEAKHSRETKESPDGSLS